MAVKRRSPALMRNLQLVRAYVAWTSRRAEVVPTFRLKLSVCIALVVFVACEGESAPRKAAEQAPRSPLATPSVADGGCENQLDVIGQESLRLGGPQLTDVDGDGTDDSVSLFIDQEAEIGCQAFLAVDIDGAVFATPVWRTGNTGGLPEPNFHSFAQTDGEDGYEIVLLEAAGASTQFVGVYSFTDGVLHPLEAPASEFGLFPYGGSVGHIEAADCARVEDDIVVSQAVPSDAPNALEKNLYDVTRRFYTPGSTKYSRSFVERKEVPIGELEQFPEFRSAPFGSCPSAP